MPNTLHLAPLANPLVVAVAYDGLCTFEFGIATEIFALSRPEMGDNWYRFAVAGVDQGEMRSTGGLRFMVDGGLELLAEAGTIVIPGWRGIDSAVPQDLIEALQAAHARGTRILSFCSGVFVLAAAGLLDGKRATTHWRYTDALTERHPEIGVSPDVLYVDAGDVLTSVARRRASTFACTSSAATSAWRRPISSPGGSSFPPIATADRRSSSGRPCRVRMKAAGSDRCSTICGKISARTTPSQRSPAGRE